MKKPTPNKPTTPAKLFMPSVVIAPNQALRKLNAFFLPLPPDQLFAPKVYDNGMASSMDTKLDLVGGAYHGGSVNKDPYELLLSAVEHYAQNCGWDVFKDNGNVVWDTAEYGPLRFENDAGSPGKGQHYAAFVLDTATRAQMHYTGGGRKVTFTAIACKL